jgi:hypothetical protein
MPDLHETITEGEITVPIEIKDSFGNFTINEEIATGATHDGRRFRVLWCFPMGLKIELLDEDGHAEVSAMPDLRAVINESVTALLSASAARNDPEELGVVDDESVTIEESQ